MNRHTCLFIAAAAALAVPASAQDYLMVTDQSADKVILLDSTTGAVVNASFILDAGGTPYDFIVPRDAIQVANEIWVIDGNSDQIVRFDLSGVFIAMIPPAVSLVDGMRGACFANNTVYIAADGAGAAADKVFMFDTAGNGLGSFSTALSGPGPNDVTEFNGELLVSHHSPANDIIRYSYAGVMLGIFHHSPGAFDTNYPQQISLAANNHVIVASFVGATTIGVYEYDAVGTLTNSYLFGSANRGCWKLPNGDILTGDTMGVDKLDGGGLVTSMYSGNCGYINRLSLSTPAVTYCTAGTSSNGCVPVISAAGTPNASASSGFTISVANVEGSQSGLIFYGVTGRVANPWGTGTSFFCVKAPVERMGVLNSGGTAGTCGGLLSIDWLAYVAAAPIAVGEPFSAGNVVDAQGWYRDPPAPKTTNLSAGIEWTMIP